MPIFSWIIQYFLAVASFFILKGRYLYALKILGFYLKEQCHNYRKVFLKSASVFCNQYCTLYFCFICILNPVVGAVFTISIWMAYVFSINHSMRHLNFPSFTLHSICNVHQSLYTQPLSFPSITPRASEFSLNHSTRNLNFPSITPRTSEFSINHSTWHLNFPSITLLGIWIFHQ